MCNRKFDYWVVILFYIPQELYDTLVDDVAKPTIFVAMKDSQAYPKYWITFKLNKTWARSAQEVYYSCS